MCHQSETYSLSLKQEILYNKKNGNKTVKRKMLDFGISKNGN